MVSSRRAVCSHRTGDTDAPGTIAEYGLKKRAEAVKKCRDIGKKDMKLNDAMPKMQGELLAQD